MHQVVILISLLSVSFFGCAGARRERAQTVVEKHPADTTRAGKPSDFIPEGYKLFEEISGDLNKDGLSDLVMIVKATNKDSIVEVENRGKLDRNRRGLIVLFKTKNGYLPGLRNYSCFSSENEDGGVYMPPDLWLEIKKGNLYIHYSHGRYGYWRYVFRHHKSDFDLIGYDSNSNRGPIVNRETSINFLTKKKIEKVNTNEEAEGGDEVFDVTNHDIYVEDILKLSAIKDFDVLEMSECCYSMP